MSKGELTRQRIVALAAPIFNQRGYSGCSIQDVMEATGLEKGGIYRHFKNKEELAAEAYRYSAQQVVEARASSLDWTLSPLNLLRQYIQHFVEHPSPIPGGCPIMNTAVDSDDGNPLLRGMVQESIKTWKKRIAEVVAEGIRHREIRKSTDPQQIANTVIAALEGALMISRIEGTRSALQDVRQSLEIILENIACNPKH